MADKRRFDLFADLLVRRFPEAQRVFDVAGGQGKLNESLTIRSRSCVYAPDYVQILSKLKPETDWEALITNACLLRSRASH